MPKSTNNAFKISLGVTLSAGLGIIGGYLFSLPIITLILLLPAVLYEVYRTEGISTKIASLLVLLLVAVQMIIIFSGVDIYLSEHLGALAQYTPAVLLEFSHVSIAIPIITAIVAAYLVIRTRGVYTRWLALVIIVVSLAVIFIVEPAVFSFVFNSA